MKNQDKYLKKNLQILKKIHPVLAHQLTLIDPSDIEFCWTQKEELNLYRLYQNQPYYYHSNSCAAEEAKDWFQSLDLHQATVIFIYGIGLGYYYEAARLWLKQHPHHTLVFLEEDLGVLYRLCETKLGNQLLKDSQVQIVFLRDSYSNSSIFNELSWTYFNDSFVFSCLKLYEEVNFEGFLDIKHEVNFQFEKKKATVDEYLRLGVIFFRNFYPNLLELPQSYWGNGLFNLFPQVPAIICGAGPSLNKNIDLLSTLKDRALIIAGGSALNALISKSILPHFGVAIDPNISQFSRVSITQPYHLPIFYRNRLFHDALLAMTGPRLYLTGAGGYTTSQWFEKQLNIEGEDLEEGHNVINFSLQIARALGCNPIIIIGTDLAFTNQNYYAEGIAESLNLSPEDFRIDNHPDLGSELVLKEDIFGQPVYTLWKWITESNWISQFAENYPHITLINATEGGLGFKDVPSLTLQEVVHKFLTKPQDILSKLDEKIQNHSLHHLSLEHILKLLQTMKENLNQCIHLLSQFVKENDQLIENIQQNSLPPSSLSSSKMILLESDLEENSAYQFLLENFNQMFTRLHQRELQDLQCPRKRLSEKKRSLKKIEWEKRRIAFLLDVAHFNSQLIQHSIDNKMMMR